MVYLWFGITQAIYDNKTHSVGNNKISGKGTHQRAGGAFSEICRIHSQFWYGYALSPEGLRRYW